MKKIFKLTICGNLRKTKLCSYIKFFLIALLLLFLFRAPLYRLLITYRSVGQRVPIEITSPILLGKIEEKAEGKTLNMKDIANIAASITNESLSFTANRTAGNPNQTIKTHEANCIGYSAMFNAIANYLIKEYRLRNEIKAVHLIGKLSFLGIDLHQFFKSAFLRDHDFNQLLDIKTGERLAIDPTISDYLWIERVYLGY